MPYLSMIMSLTRRLINDTNEQSITAQPLTGYHSTKHQLAVASEEIATDGSCSFSVARLHHCYTVIVPFGGGQPRELDTR